MTLDLKALSIVLNEWISCLRGPVPLIVGLECAAEVHLQVLWLKPAVSWLKPYSPLVNSGIDSTPFHLIIPSVAEFAYPARGGKPGIMKRMEEGRSFKHLVLQSTNLFKGRSVGPFHFLPK